MGTHATQILDYAASHFRLESLNNSLESTPDFINHPNMARDWDDIGVTLLAELKNDAPSSVEYFKICLDAIRSAIKKVKEFKLKYSDFLEDISLQRISLQEKLLCFYKKRNHAFYLLYKKASETKKPIKKVEAIRDWLKILSNDVFPLLEKYKLPISVISETIYFLENVCTPERLSSLQDTPVKGKQEKSDLADLMNHIHCYSLNLQDLCVRLKMQDRLIPFEIEGEITYLSPNSAEGKALQRIEEPIPDQEWMTVVEEGQEVDVEGALERLKKRGYKIKVPS